MSETIDVTRTTPTRVLMVVANPSMSTTVGGPVGFWASELTHPYLAFVAAGYEVEIASPEGGPVELDAFSDPRHESGYSADDLISLGFLARSDLARLLEGTPRLDDLDPGDFDAIVVCGGQSPMFTFRGNGTLENALRDFYEAEKPTAALCHGVSALLDVRLSDGSHLIDGKTITGFSNMEEDAVDGMFGTQVMPWRIEDVATERGANFAVGGLWKAFAVRDGRLITGQQQYSGGRTADLVIASLGT